MTWLADAVFAATLVEAVVLILWGRRLGVGIRPADALRMLLPGAALTMALWLALAGGSLAALATALTVALAAHLLDLAYRVWPRQRRRASAANRTP